MVIQIAFACGLSFEKGTNEDRGILTFQAYSEDQDSTKKLEKFYRTKYGAIMNPLGFMEIHQDRSRQLIKEYLNDFRGMNDSIKKLKNEISGLSKLKGFLSKLFSSDNSTKVQELEKKVENIKQEMWNMLGINYWSEVLYFHFEN